MARAVNTVCKTCLPKHTHQTKNSNNSSSECDHSNEDEEENVVTSLLKETDYGSIVVGKSNEGGSGFGSSFGGPFLGGMSSATLSANQHSLGLKGVVTVDRFGNVIAPKKVVPKWGDENDGSTYLVLGEPLCDDETNNTKDSSNPTKTSESNTTSSNVSSNSNSSIIDPPRCRLTYLSLRGEGSLSSTVMAFTIRLNKLPKQGEFITVLTFTLPQDDPKRHTSNLPMSVSGSAPPSGVSSNSTASSNASSSGTVSSSSSLVLSPPSANAPQDLGVLFIDHTGSIQVPRSRQPPSPRARIRPNRWTNVALQVYSAQRGGPCIARLYINAKLVWSSSSQTTFPQGGEAYFFPYRSHVSVHLSTMRIIMDDSLLDKQAVGVRLSILS